MNHKSHTRSKIYCHKSLRPFVKALLSGKRKEAEAAYYELSGPALIFRTAKIISIHTTHGGEKIVTTLRNVSPDQLFAIVCPDRKTHPKSISYTRRSNTQHRDPKETSSGNLGINQANHSLHLGAKTQIRPRGLWRSLGGQVRKIPTQIAHLSKGLIGIRQQEANERLQKLST